MPKISAVIPVYNVEEYLPRCMESVLEQSLEDIEIICVDDGSTDNSSSILETYASEDRRIKVIHQSNSGYGKAMNVGMREVTGKYFAVLEPDDFILPDAYKILYESAERFNADVVRADYFDSFTENGKSLLKARQLSKDYSWYYHLLCPNKALEVYMFVMHNWTGIHRTSFLREHKIQFNETPGASFQDNGFFFQVFTQTDRLLYIPCPCYCYNIENPNSSIHSKNKVYAAADEYNYIYDFLEQHQEFKATVEPVYYARMFRIYHQTFLRVASEFRKEFATFFRNTFLEASKNHKLQTGYMTIKEREFLRYLLESPEKYMSVAIPLEESTSSEKAKKLFTICCEEGITGLKSRVKRKMGLENADQP